MFESSDPSEPSPKAVRRRIARVLGRVRLPPSRERDFGRWAEKQAIQREIRETIGEILRASRQDANAAAKPSSLGFAIFWHYTPKTANNNAEYAAALRNHLKALLSELAGVGHCELELLVQFLTALVETIEPEFFAQPSVPYTPPEPLAIMPIQPTAPNNAA
jgi:hypothetical protein